MRSKTVLSLAATSLMVLVILVGFRLTADDEGKAPAQVAKTQLTENDRMINAHAQRMIEEGRQIFRFDTFGSEAFWGDALQLHKAIAGEKNGGVGSGVSPKTALSVGLKVDVDALPKDLQNQLKAGKVNLDDPATTVALLKLSAVVGVKGIFDDKGILKSMGLQCAFCQQQSLYGLQIFNEIFLLLSG